MAKYYTNFSTQLDDLSKDEIKWWRKRLKHYGDQDGDFDYLDFSYQIDKDSVWFYSEESGNPMQVAELISEFFAAFKRNDMHPMAWAYYCSQPRIDEQRGGAALITGKQIYYLDSLNWLREKQAELKP